MKPKPTWDSHLFLKGNPFLPALCAYECSWCEKYGQWSRQLYANLGRGFPRVLDLVFHPVCAPLWWQGFAFFRTNARISIEQRPFWQTPDSKKWVLHGIRCQASGCWTGLGDSWTSICPQSFKSMCWMPQKINQQTFAKCRRRRRRMMMTVLTPPPAARLHNFAEFGRWLGGVYLGTSPWSTIHTSLLQFLSLFSITTLAKMILPVSPAALSLALSRTRPSQWMHGCSAGVLGGWQCRRSKLLGGSRSRSLLFR